MGGKGSSQPQYSSQDYWNYGRSLKEGSPKMTGLEGLDPNMEGYDQIYGGYMERHNERVQEEKFKIMMENMMFGQQQQAYDYAAAQREAAEEARRQAGLAKRDAFASNYMDAANEATSFVNEKIAAEKANAALMGVDYVMTDEIKNERISNYFGSIWSEGQQQELDAAIGEWGTPEGFEQTIFRGGGVEAGPEGSVGQQKAGGGIAPKKKTLIDEEETLGTASVLGG